MVRQPVLRAIGVSVISAAGESLTHGVDLELPAGSTTALVGPSGAGKSLTLRAMAALLPVGLKAEGHVRIGDNEVLAISRRRLRSLRGRSLGWIGQDATASLNPTVTVGRHFIESMRAHRESARSRSVERDRGWAALSRVGLACPEQIWAAYPFELSGGQTQRVAIALATLGDPQVVLADEVTAELDPHSRAEVLHLLRDHADSGGAVLMVTHDLAAAAQYADQTVVMEAGQVVEQGPSADLLHEAAAPLTRAWVASLTRPVPRRQRELLAPSPRPIVLRCSGVRRELHGHGRHTLALEDIDLDIHRGEAIAIVGPSGSGKSTLVGVLAALDRPDAGDVRVNGINAWSQSPSELRGLRRSVGLLFQDALSSFDPRYTVRQVVAEGLAKGSTTTEEDLMGTVGLDAGVLGRRPVTLSGGQCQRVALARALAAKPTILLADEPTSGLDVLAQDQLVDAINQTRCERGTTVVLVTHDLRLARMIADRIVVLDQGRIVEDMDAMALDDSRHPTTRGLLEASGPSALRATKTSSRQPEVRRAPTSAHTATTRPASP